MTADRGSTHASGGVRHAHGQSAAGAGKQRLLIVFGLVAAMMVVEVVTGILTNSLALLADAGHMLTDAAGIGLALLAIWFAARPATPEMSFGYYRVEIFAAVANGVILFGVAAFILYEALQRLASPAPVVGLPVLVVAAIGLVVNLVSIRLLQPGAKTSLNLRGAYLEVLGDLLGSAAVLVAGLVIIFWGWTPIDPIASILIAVLILPRTWGLMRDSVDVLLEATPRDVDLDEVRTHILDSPGVQAVHDLHAWTITSGMKVVSAHVVMGPDGNPGALLDHLGDCLSADFDIDHSTFQLETPDHVLWEGRASRIQH